MAVGLIAAVLVTVLAGRHSANQDVRSTLIGHPAPPVAGPSVTPYGFSSLSGLRGRWALVNFFATWCVPCQQEQPHLAAFAVEHRRSGDVQLVMVVYNDSVANVGTFLRTRGGIWPAVEDPAGQTALSYGVAGIPETYLVDPNGIIVAKIVGASTTAGLDALVANAKARNL
ncbi:MAG: TlpA family protein disulfide reductase [Actinomycetota bacterium]|nr:TlpA family protein disulfide reductase [Actinomycetota bacterium]